MTEEKKHRTVPFDFVLSTISPDPQNKTMRTNLEAREPIQIRVNLPRTNEFVDNNDLFITAELSPDVEMPSTAVLTPAGLAKLYELLSVPFSPEPAEEVSEEEWGDEDDDFSDEDDDDDFSDEDDDDDWGDDDDDWEDE
jgi:hypothetical protein